MQYLCKKSDNATQCSNMQKYAKNAKILCENQEILYFCICFKI